MFQRPALLCLGHQGQRGDETTLTFIYTCCMLQSVTLHASSFLVYCCPMRCNHIKRNQQSMEGWTNTRNIYIQMGFPRHINPHGGRQSTFLKTVTHLQCSRYLENSLVNMGSTKATSLTSECILSD
jgi:hypothetical protein